MKMASMAILLLFLQLLLGVSTKLIVTKSVDSSRLDNPLPSLVLPLPDAAYSSSALFRRTAAPPLTAVGLDSDVLARARTAGSHGGSVAAVISVDLASGHLRLGASAGDQLPVAWAKYNNTVDSNGWAHFSVTATDDRRVSRELRMYTAGFLEGFLSARQIRHFQHNTLALLSESEKEHNALGNIKDMFANQVFGIVKRSSRLQDLPAAERRWHEQAHFALMQAWGILDAYNGQVEAVDGKPMSMIDLMVLSSDGETPELEKAFAYDEVAMREDKQKEGGILLQTLERTRGVGSKRFAPAQAEKYWRHIKEKYGRCSALVRLSEGGEDLFVGHSTFSGYSEMNRIFKYYDLPLGEGVVQKMGFSSYPGVSGSTDDYYLLQSGLVVTETTISLQSDEPYDDLRDTDKGLPDFMRIMLANRLAESGQDWIDLMSRSSTGTYSSQWMVVDYGRFKKKQQLKAGTLLVLEQVPGLSHSEDMSQHLQSHGFWASENRAWFEDVRDKSGSTSDERLYGDLFSKDKNPRSKIFARTAPAVQTLAEMRSEMRRNKSPHEGALTLTENTPDHAIASRGDLTTNPSDNGAVDAKVTNSCLMKSLKCDAISGPTWQDQKPFQWTDESGKEMFPGEPREGLPNKWAFDWVRMADSGLAPLSDGNC
eukprot:TRINITY_DN69614_c0_g1_i1.p1 TRINITY_DN69614_c0_g1~~TRINITY_DN69614_c0_g1_i1.p1  ORF type:complete len:653 (-),score=125.54 TRINITY_DN69614_c0_g1_i1:11-1969(-)